jgi:diketogulonate reductase-like aldo/keto reductase
MKYETIHGLTLPKIGFGTWKIGGQSSSNPKVDSISLAALRSALELGYTHIDTAETYADGHAEELIGRVVREMHIPRESIFITTKVQPEHLKYEQVLAACEASLRRLQMDYIDLYLIHWPIAGMKLEDTFRALNKLVHDSKVEHLGVSNFDIKLLKRSQALSETAIITDQVPYSISDRSYVKNGVLEYCQQNDILLTAYSPVAQGHFRVNKTLQSIAGAHAASPYQIAIAWLAMQPRVITIPMSFNPSHIKENQDAADIVLSEAEMNELN